MRLIDADRLLTDRMKEHYYHLPNGDIAIPIIDIEHAPTIEPRKGRWIPRKADNGFHTDCICSVCKSRHAIGWNFCPNCGADMREGECG